ncbi:MAG TPA: hypothetical protein VKY22_05590 [Bradyrhizobium sp.]|nr:hypothetical protein [Bradyrhizobium sp.]
MNAPVGSVFYLAWTAIIVLGAVFEFVDRRWIKGPALGLLLFAGIPVGYIMTKASPFNFADGGLGLQGFLLVATSGVALISYAASWLLNLARRRFGKRADR